MRPRNLSARDQLIAHLHRGSARAGELAAALGVSPRSVLRMLDELGPSLCAVGETSRRRYALRRALRGDSAPLPLFGVDAEGRIHELGALSLLQPRGAFLDLSTLGWPADGEGSIGLWTGLPYPLHDLAPRGHLGRLFAHQTQASLELPPEPADWDDDEIALATSRRGDDAPGHLILGERSLKAHQQQRQAPPDPLPSRGLPKAYAARAEASLVDTHAGALVGGQFPKFTAVRELGGSATPHVIVKFSGPAGSVGGERWADLLICEHLAAAHAARLTGVPPTRSRLIQAQGRTLLELERFDRQGRFGRLPLLSLAALNRHLALSSSRDWTEHAEALQARGLLDDEGFGQVLKLWWFGRLIANTDMTLDNLSFVPGRGTLALSPVYDMLPMALAPQWGGDALPEGIWPPPLPPPRQAAAWRQACAAAVEFWTEVSAEPYLGASLRSLGSAHRKTLLGLADHV